MTKEENSHWCNSCVHKYVCRGKEGATKYEKEARSLNNSYDWFRFKLECEKYMSEKDCPPFVKGEGFKGMKCMGPCTFELEVLKI